MFIFISKKLDRKDLERKIKGVKKNLVNYI